MLDLRQVVLMLVLVSASAQETIMTDGGQLCIGNSDHHGLKQSLLKQPQNLDNLIQAFFPTNRQASISVEVTYKFVDSELSVKYRWVNSPINLLIRSDVLKYLSLFMYNVEVRHVIITLDRFCCLEDPSIALEHYDHCFPSSSTHAHLLLNDLTADVSSVVI